MHLSPRTHIRTIFQNRDLGYLWAGQVVSMSGDSIYQIALLWLALELTASKTITGLVAMSSYLPTLFFALIAGVVADRANRRHIMLIADAVRVIAIFGIPIASALGVLSPGVLVANAFVIACAAAFFNPAKDAIIPQLVPRSGLLRANSLIQTSWQLAVLIGPAIAGVLLTIFGLIPLFAIDASAYAFSFVMILLIRPSVRVTRPGGPISSAYREVQDHPKDPTQRQTYPDQVEPHPKTEPRKRLTRKILFERIRAGAQDIGIGLRYVVKDKIIFPLLLITVADNLFIMGPAIVGLPVLVRETLHGSASDYALMATCFAIGMLLGTAALIAWGSRIPKGKMLLWGMMLDGFTFIPFLFAGSLLQLGIMSVVHGIGVPLLTVSRASLIQEVAPEDMRGRVFSLISLAVVGMSAVSSGLTGIVLEFITAPVLFAIIGTTGGLCGVAGLLFARQLRRQV